MNWRGVSPCLRPKNAGRGSSCHGWFYFYKHTWICLSITHFPSRCLQEGYFFMPVPECQGCGSVGLTVNGEETQVQVLVCPVISNHFFQILKKKSVFFSIQYVWTVVGKKRVWIQPFPGWPFLEVGHKALWDCANKVSHRPLFIRMTRQFAQ